MKINYTIKPWVNIPVTELRPKEFKMQKTETWTPVTKPGRNFIDNKEWMQLVGSLTYIDANTVKVIWNEKAVYPNTYTLYKI